MSVRPITEAERATFDASAIPELSPAEIRAALDTLGMRYSGNSVRPYRGARQVDRCKCIVSAIESPLRGAYLEVTLHHGKASDGYKTDYTRRDVYWTVVAVTDRDGRRYWATGTRSTSERKARAEFTESARSMRADGIVITY